MNISDTTPVGTQGDEALQTALLGLLICIVSFVFIGPFIGILAALPFMEGDLTTLADRITNPSAYPDFRVPMYVIQGVSAFVGLILAPYIYLKIRREEPVRQFLSSHKSALSYVLTILVVISFMGFNSYIIEWNAGAHLPDAWSDLEDWAREREEQALQITEYLTSVTTVPMFILAFFVIAVIPGIGEELVFRGVFQKKIQDAGLNGHAAIWLGAILFSAIHIQFFGFFPRMFLGALFGYLYWWSGDLKVPMLAHFANNAVTLIMVFQGAEEEDVESLPLVTGIIMTIITGALLFFLYNHWKKGQGSAESWQSVFTTDKIYQAEIVKSVLSETMNAVIVNKRDSSYNIGHYEVHVPKEKVMRAVQIINNDITFQ